MLFSLSLFRVIFVYIILFYTKLPQFIKILLLMLSDSFDLCARYNNYYITLEIYKNLKCSDRLYHVTDKITDCILYGILLFQIYIYNLLDKTDIKLITVLYIYRLIGVVINIITSYKKLLVFFSNIFLFITLTIFVIKYFTKNYKNYLSIKNYKVLFFVVIMIKIIQEYHLHY